MGEQEARGGSHGADSTPRRPAPAPASAALSGRTLRDPRSRGSVTFAVTGAESGGRLLSTVSVLRPGFPRPPLHVHPHQTERFAVRRGRLEVVHAGRTVLLGPGETLDVPPGVPHTFAVAGEEVEVQVDFSPAGDMEGFLVGLWRLSGFLPSVRGVRGLAALALAHPADFRLARLPARAQRALLGALVPRRSRGVRETARQVSGAPPHGRRAPAWAARRGGGTLRRMTPSRLRRLTPLVYVECDIREDETLRAWRRRSHPASRPTPARRLLRRAVRLRRA